MNQKKTINESNYRDLQQFNRLFLATNSSYSNYYHWMVYYWVIKVTISAIFLAIGLRRMGIADDIINLAFGITLDALAVNRSFIFQLRR